MSPKGRGVFRCCGARSCNETRPEIAASCCEVTPAPSRPCVATVQNLRGVKYGMLARKAMGLWQSSEASRRAVQFTWDPGCGVGRRKYLEAAPLVDNAGRQGRRLDKYKGQTLRKRLGCMRPSADAWCIVSNSGTSFRPSIRGLLSRNARPTPCTGSAPVRQSQSAS